METVDGFTKLCETIIKEKEESKKNLTQIRNKSITTRSHKEIYLKIRCENIALQLENIIKNKNA